MLKAFIAEYGTVIIYTILCGIIAYIGAVVKSFLSKYMNDKTKREVAKTVVQAVEQLYKDLHGEEKLEKAISAASDMLLSKGITITELELRMLIEAALAEFNDVFGETADDENEALDVDEIEVPEDPTDNEVFEPPEEEEAETDTEGEDYEITE